MNKADAPSGVDCGTEKIETGTWSCKGAVLLAGIGFTAVVVVTEIVATVSGRVISSTVETVLGARFSLNKSCIDMMVTSLSLAWRLALLAMIWSPSTVCKPALLKTRAGLGTVLEFVEDVSALGVICMFLAESGFFLGRLGRKEAVFLTGVKYLCEVW